MSGITPQSKVARFTATATILLEMNITGRTVRVRSEIINGRVTYSINGNTTTSTIGNRSAGRVKIGTYSIDGYYSSVIPDLEKNYFISSNPAIGNYEFTYKYEGMGSYNGYPVYKYTVAYTWITNSASLNATGELYLHIGLLLPLYMHVNAEGNDQGSRITSSLTLKTVEANLPSTSVQSVVKTGKGVIIAGGLPGAKTTFKGCKGSTRLNVSNNGNQPGYIMIIRKQGLTAAYIPTSTIKNNYKVEGIAPGETKQVDLGFTLDKDISATTQEVSGGPDWLVVTIIIGIIAAAVGGIIWLIHHIKVKARKTTETPVPGEEQPPAPETLGETPGTEGEGGTLV
jgi:hypothetical protein